MKTAIIEGRSRTLEVTDYRVSQAVNSIIPGDMSGGTASATVTVRADEDADLLNRYLTCVDHHITITDNSAIEGTNFKGRGVWSGVISKASRSGSFVTFDVNSILNTLNVTKTAEPVFGRARPSSITSYVVNLSTNPSGEAGTTNYTLQAGTGGTAAYTNPSPTAPFAGSKTVRLTWSVAATGVGGIMYTQAGITAGNLYFFSTNLRADGPQMIQFSLQWLNASNATVGSPIVGTTDTVDDQGWKAYQVSATAPATATQARLSLFNFNDGTVGSPYHAWANGSFIEADGWMVSSGSSDYLPYFDGSFANATWQGAANSSASQLAIMIPQDTGYDATFSYAFRYYCSLVGISATSIELDPYFDDIFVSLPRWTGNVLDRLKDLCAAYGAIFTLVNDIIVVSLYRNRNIRIDDLTGSSQIVTSQSLARAVGINNYNATWLTDSLAAVPDNVYSLSAGIPLAFTLSTDHSLVSVNDPICVSAINPQPYTSGTGQYVVMDSNNFVVSPSVWTKAGGAIYTSLVTDDPTRIQVSVLVPNSVPGYTSPFRLSMLATGGEVPSLYITGTGVFVDKEVVYIYTGASESDTKLNTLPIVDNILLSDPGRTHDVGLYAADDAAGAAASLSGSFGHDPDANGQEFGIVEGSRFGYNYGIYLITSAEITPGSISISAKMDFTFADLTNLYALIFAEFNATYSGLTFATFNALFVSTFTMDDFNAQSNTPTMDDWNAVYSGAVFNDHSVYPGMREKVIEDGEARA